MPTHPFSRLEIEFSKNHSSDYLLAMRFRACGSDADNRSGNFAVVLDLKELKAYLDGREIAEYGQKLSACVFASPAAKAYFADYLISAQRLDSPIRIQVTISEQAPELHEIIWEALCNPENNQFLTIDGNIWFSRYLPSHDRRPISPTTPEQLRAVAAASNPNDLDKHKLAPVDTNGEITRVRQSLGATPIQILPQDQRPVTLDNLVEEIQDGVELVYLACHGFLKDGEPMLVLEEKDRTSCIVHGKQLVYKIKSLPNLPRLIVLASCESAGKEQAGALSSLGPLLAQAGVPAVLAMHGKISMETVKDFIPAFFSQMQKDGQIDRALAAARNKVQHRPDFWVPVLFLRSESGKLWELKSRLTGHFEHKKVEIILEGDFEAFTSDRQQTTIEALAAILKIAPEDIRILKVSKGSVVIIIEMPDVAANRLYEMATSRDFKLFRLGIQSVAVEGREVINLADNRSEKLLKILIVESNQKWQELFSTLLSSFYDLHIVDDVTQAIEKIQNEDIRLAFVNRNLLENAPGMPDDELGLDILVRIRDEYPALPCVVLVGDFQEMDAPFSRYLHLGVKEVLYKGHINNQEQLLSIVRKHISPVPLTGTLRMGSEGQENTQSIDKKTERIKALFFASNPEGALMLRLEEEIRSIAKKVRDSKYGIAWELVSLSPGQPDDLLQALNVYKPQIVHFWGYGTTTGAVFFENEIGERQPVEPDVVATLFEQFSDTVKCVILNASYSEVLAKTVAEHIEYVIGIRGVINDAVAIAFSTSFYQALGAGLTIKGAFQFGIVQVRLQGVPDHLTPVLVTKEK